MHIFNKKKQPIELEVVPEVLGEEIVAPSTGERRSISELTKASELANRASQTFFQIGIQRGVVRAAPGVTPPARPLVVREVNTGLLRTAYREIVVRFQPKTPEQTRDRLLSQYGFQIRRSNPYVPNQFVVFDPERNYLNETLIEVANGWTETDEVVFATPNFVSQYRREAPPRYSFGRVALAQSGPEWTGVR